MSGLSCRHANEELKDNNSSSDDEIENTRQREESARDQKEKEKEIRGEYTDEEGVRWVLNKPKPTFVLLQPEFVNNKTRNNHFMRYSDVKSKDLSGTLKSLFMYDDSWKGKGGLDVCVVDNKQDDVYVGDMGKG
uniref:Histone deacetylase complex subunit SAP130 C-terminal domain-containing protein n=1 Tax=Biomphalaria glabrata TaxID=6526 RepID=A0A2C9LRX7_BIOGL